MNTNSNRPKHTPGPWTCHSTIVRGPKETDLSSGGRGIAKLYAPETKAERVEQEANARLIAAAPELLEALREALSCIDQHTDDPVVGPIIQTARAAIAKAGGRDE